jgi:hypothetical protein
MPVDLSAGNKRNKYLKSVKKHSFCYSGSIPSIYREIYETINLHGFDKLTLAVFVPLFESSTLTKTILNQVEV